MAAQGDTLVIGSNQINRLAVLERDSQGVWDVAQIFDNFALVNDPLGWAIAIDGDTIAVGTDRDPFDFPGEVLTLNKVGGVWVQGQTLHAPDSIGMNDGFGFSVDIKGDRLIVGDRDAGPNENGFPYNPGAAYVFERDSSGVWNFKWKLRRQDAHLEAELGMDDVLGDDFAVVGDQNAFSVPNVEKGPLCSMTSQWAVKFA